jgi:hypothetical protein
MAYLLPVLPVRQNTPMRGAIELIEFDTNRRVQKTKLCDDFLSCFRRMSYIQQGREQVGKIQIQGAQRGDESLNLVRFRIEQLNTIVHLLAQLVPVHIHEGMRAGYLSYDIIGDAGTFSELGQVELLYPAAFADVMNQIERVPFSPKKSHD